MLHGYYGYGLGYGGVLSWVAPILMILFWVLIIVTLVLAIRYFLGRGRTAGAGETPLEILKKRYARGELDKAEFEDKKRDLT